MDVISLCPLMVSGFEWQSQHGARALTVMCKATFELSPGEARLTEEQDALSDEDVYWDDDPSRSLCSSTDIAPYKPRADVVLVGHAYAPKQQPTRSFRARLIVGEIDKSIEVWCHRGYRAQDGQVFEGPRITKMDLRWERASGGPETNNPVGKRFDGQPDAYGTVWIGSLQPPGLHIASRRDTFTPVCFAPIAPTWPSRVQKLHRHARSFAAQGWQGAPLPEDFDYGYFNIAPPDQQPAELRANERIILENLHPQHERLITSLPGLRPRAIVDRVTGEREEIALVADTLWIDTDRAICTMVWRGRLGLRSAREVGRVAIWLDGLPAVAPSAGAAGAAVDSDFSAIETITIVPMGKEVKASALPFMPGPPVQPPRGVEGAGVPPAWAGAPVRAIDPKDDGTGTIVAGFAISMAKETLPFAKGALEAPLPPPLFVPPLVPLAMGPEPETTRGEPRVETKAAAGVHPAEAAPPAMIGPLATPDVAVQGVKEEPAAPKPQEPVALAAPAKKVSPEEFGLERCAALTARIARDKPAKTRILEGEDLTTSEWAVIEKHWADAIKEETKRGRRGLLDRFDQAYVAQLEEERGLITMEDYARLSVAAERGTVDEVLRGMGLPRGAVMRIEREWLRRAGEDVFLAQHLENAIEIARAAS